MWPAPYVCFDNWDVLVARKTIKYVLKRSDACVLCLEMTFLLSTTIEWLLCYKCALCNNWITVKPIQLQQSTATFYRVNSNSLLGV